MADSPLFSRVWRFSRISRFSKFSRISRKWTFLKRPLFQKTPFSEPDLMGCFPVDFQEVKQPLRAKSGKRPIKVRKRPIKEGKRPIKAMVLVGISVGCLMGCFLAPPAMVENGPSKKAHQGVYDYCEIAPTTALSDIATLRWGS